MRLVNVRVLLFAALLLAAAGPARAQAIGSIFGKVTDPSGGVLPPRVFRAGVSINF